MNKSANFVVIGSGGAGMAAAVTAMYNGVKDIIVLEKTPFLGGNSRMAGGSIFVADPEGINEGNQKVDDVFRDTMAFHHYRMVDPKILRAFLDESRNSRIFFEEMGIPYNPGGTMAASPYPFGNFYAAIKRMEQLLLEGGNTVLRNTAATRILTDDTGVIGVEATDENGNSFLIETKNAAITTGGFTGNSQLLHEYFPDDYDDLFYTDALPLQGDGIALAKSAGAALAKYCTIVKENGYSCDSRLDAPNRGAHQACTVWVNAYGERFLDESSTMGNEVTNALVRQPGMIGYALFDGNIFHEIETNPMVMGGPGGMPPMGGEPGEGMPKMRHGGPGNPKESIEKEYKLKTGWVKKADTIEELATEIGVDVDTLVNTVNEYNGYCEKGRDGLFAKDAKYLIPVSKAPFYALKFRPILIDTQGPIIINEKMQVLNDAHKPIPGLYAGGVCTSGCQGQDYHLRGSNLGYAVTSGRIIGMQVAKR